MMLELLVQGALLGILLAFLIGPVFFVLLDTSISKGPLAAAALDLGILTSDLFCLVLAYLASRQLEHLVQDNPWFFIIGGGAIIGYGVYLFAKPFRYQRPSQKHVPSTRKMLGLFVKGFLLNIVNPGVILFWVTVVILVGSRYNLEPRTLVLHFGATFFFFILSDAFKILGAERLKRLARPRQVFRFQRLLAGGLVLWGALVLLRGIF